MHVEKSKSAIMHEYRTNPEMIQDRHTVSVEG